MTKLAIGWYNGWSPEERGGFPKHKDLIAAGRLARPTTCSVCGHAPEPGRWSANPVWFHDEDYANPLAAYPICRTCHVTLHRRFDDPEPWRELVARHATGDRWFEALTMDSASLQRPFGVTYPNGSPEG